MENNLDCLLIGFKDYDINARILAAKRNIASYNNCKYQFVRYQGKKYYYDQFLNSLINSKENISINELPYYGILYLYNYLVERGFNVEYYNYFDADIDKIMLKVSTCTINVIAISSVYYTDPYPLVYLVKFFRKHAPKTKIVIGGAYIYNKYLSQKTNEFERELHLLGADFVICESQGEYSLNRLIHAVKVGDNKYENINNLFYLKDGKYRQTVFCREDNSLINNQINWNNFEPNKLGKTINLRTSRGCLYNCSFCNYPIRNNPFSIDSVDNVIEQLKQLSNAQNIIFIDDSFNVPLQRFKQICMRIIDENIQINWFSYFRLNCCDEEAVQLMKESGCKGVFLGIESGSDAILDNMNKHTSTEIYRRGISLLKKYNILTFAYFLIGFPGETLNTIMETIEFINDCKIDYYSFNLWFAEVETPVYKKASEYNLIGSGFEWKHCTMDAVNASVAMKFFFENVNEDTIYIPGENFSFWGIPYLLGKGYCLKDINFILKLLQKNICSERDVSEDVVRQISQIINRRN